MFGNGNIDDEVVIDFATALAGNTSLKVLKLSGNNGLTSRGWNALANTLCDKSNAETLYASNHTLHKVWASPDDINVHLQLNENANKVEVARQKILRYHFKNGEDNIDELVDMEMNVLPQAMSWMCREDYTGQSLLYNFVRSMPTIFDSKSMQVRTAAYH